MLPLGINAFQFFVQKISQESNQGRWLPGKYFSKLQEEWKAAAGKTLVCRLRWLVGSTKVRVD